MQVNVVDVNVNVCVDVMLCCVEFMFVINFIFINVVCLFLLVIVGDN